MLIIIYNVQYIYIYKYWLYICWCRWWTWRRRDSCPAQPLNEPKKLLLGSSTMGICNICFFMYMHQ